MTAQPLHQIQEPPRLTLIPATPPRQITPRSLGSVAPETARALQDTLRELAMSFGLQGGHYVHLGHAMRNRDEDCTTLPARFVATSVSDRRLYLEERGLASDPTARRAIGAHTPFVWSAVADNDAGEGRRWLAGRLKGRGVHGGVAAPVQDYAAGPAYISLYSAFSGEAEQIIATRAPELAHAAAAFHEEAKAKISPYGRNGGDVALTAREMDCLRLASVGHTVAETAIVLNVTSRTVEFHLKNATDKFDTPNKLSAVALAISRGLISF